MEIDYENRPAYTTVVAILEEGESIIAESGSMVSYTKDIEIETERSGAGLLDSLKKSFFSDESMYVNKYTATAPDQEVKLAQNLPGDIKEIDLDEDSVYIQAGSYIANGTGITTESTTGDLNSVFGGEGLFFLKAEGTGSVFVGAYGGITRKELEEGETLTVDSGHTVAWSEDVTYNARKIGGLKQTLLSGEGIVMDFTGPGVIYLQSRNYEDLLSDINTKIQTQ